MICLNSFKLVQTTTLRSQRRLRTHPEEGV